MVTAPTIALLPGSTNTTAVKQLQDWLVSQGYMTPEERATGYGTYGSRTTAAVLAYQKASKIDYSSGPGDWGPRSIAAVSTTPAASSGSATQANGAGATPASSGTGSASAGGDYAVGQKITSNKITGDPSIMGTATYLGNGQWKLSDSLHGDYQGTVSTQDVGNRGFAVSSTSAGAGTSSAPAGTGAPDPTRTTATPEETAALNAILADKSLTSDMKAAIQSVYDATKSGDAEKAARVVAAMNAASQFSDPYFKAQIRLATDALDRGLNAKDGDLAFSEGQLKNALDDLKANTVASEGQLSMQHSQELKDLQTKYETDLNTTQDTMAASGFTSSSKRARAEQILGDNNTGLVESSNKTYGYQTGNLDRALASSDASTQAQIANLQRLNDAGKLDLYRSTEAAVGSDNLPSVGGLDPLGGVGGTIPRQQTSDAVSFASNFVN